MVDVGDVDIFHFNHSFRKAALQVVAGAAASRIEALMQRRELLAKHRPSWTFQPVFLLFDVYHPTQIWLDEAEVAFNGHTGLIKEIQRVIRILKQSSSKYRAFVFSVDAVSAIVDLICIDLPLGKIEEALKKKQSGPVPTTAKKSAKRRKKK